MVEHGTDAAPPSPRGARLRQCGGRPLAVLPHGGRGDQRRPQRRVRRRRRADKGRQCLEAQRTPPQPARHAEALKEPWRLGAAQSLVLGLGAESAVPSRCPANLAALLEQACERYSVRFVVAGADDAAVSVIESLRERYPGQEALVVAGPGHGHGQKPRRPPPAARQPTRAAARRSDRGWLTACVPLASSEACVPPGPGAEIRVLLPEQPVQAAPDAGQGHLLSHAREDRHGIGSPARSLEETGWTIIPTEAHVIATL
jgi:hypothetical protein